MATDCNGTESTIKRPLNCAQQPDSEQTEQQQHKKRKMPERAVTPPVLQSGLPSAKQRKYDRQLRLWAAQGQQALEEASILLINSGSGVVGVEALKNLILPGAGHLTIVDAAQVVAADLGVNFFLSQDSLGRSRAIETARFLQALNPAVQVRGVQESADHFATDANLSRFDLVILVGPSLEVRSTSRICLEKEIPLFYVHSLGFYSQISVQLPPLFPIVETHPDPVTSHDLRLLSPWPDLLQFMRAQTTGMETMSDHHHAHIPYLLILLYGLDHWKTTHAGSPPSTYEEKKDFKALIESWSRDSAEENFAEAAAAVLKSLNQALLPQGLRDIFQTTECKSPSNHDSDFWLIACAIAQHYEQHGTLPLPGALSDMKAQSADYVQLQNLYKTKARSDVEEVTHAVRKLESSQARQSPVAQSQIEAFCKNAAHVKLIRGKPLRFAAPQAWPSDISMALQSPDHSLLPLYLGFLAYDQCVPSSPTPVLAALKAIPLASSFLDSILTVSIVTVDVTPLKVQIERILTEFARSNSGELHNISALTGGILAQEVIKVITKQYIPANSVCVFDGIGSRSAVFDA